MRFKDTFKTLNGREATQDDVQKFERMVSVLDTNPSDAMLCVLVALDYHQKLYEEMPARITKTATEALAKFKTAADAQAKASFEAGKEAMAAGVVAVAQGVANNVSARQKWKWACGCIVLSVLAAGGLAFFMHSIGQKAGSDIGYANGYKSAMDEKAALAWSNSDQGKKAYRFATSGLMDGVTKCNLTPNWVIEKGICYPRPDKEGRVSGWYMNPK